MRVINILGSRNYIILNKDLIKIFGLVGSALIGELCSEYLIWESANRLVEGEYFYSTREKIEREIGINAYFQRITIKELESKGVLTLKRMGIPCKLHYKINEDALEKCLEDAKSSVVHQLNNKKNNSSTSGSLTDTQQGSDEVHINNNNIIINNNNNNIHTQAKILPEEQKKQFAKLVTMTEQEYQDLIKDYGETTTDQLIEQLNLYKQAHGKSYESDYAAIKIWVTKRVQEMKAEEEKLKQKQKNNNVNNQKNYNQREYPPDFFDSLYANNKWR